MKKFIATCIGLALSVPVLANPLPKPIEGKITKGWHAAQDCMAGTINNSMIAIILDEEKVPQIWQNIATKTYAATPSAIPWEKEAFWAGKTENMTMNALKACANGNMWEVYTPTPMTGEWLEKNGFIKGG